MTLSHFDPGNGRSGVNTRFVDEDRVDFGTCQGGFGASLEDDFLFTQRIRDLAKRIQMKGQGNEGGNG